ncbi:MAG: hypothetical protein H6573_03570 [Lewinellaceae bacterium]|nr:hypothetical protein [Phaeodactylibacter sp.]MCB0614317.1 hypothetical protein [Phaeodactylibacter sp.]MCB9346575.1 hypothetical protein [Lewinellaceae bacterium]
MPVAGEAEVLPPAMPETPAQPAPEIASADTIPAEARAIEKEMRIL